MTTGKRAGSKDRAAVRRASEGRIAGWETSAMPHATASSSGSLERGPGTDITSWMCLVPFATEPGE